jgi:hypothetical protein
MPPRQNAAAETQSPPRVVHSTSNDEIKVSKNRPSGSKLRQQKLPAWQPILTAYTAIPVVFVMGAIFIPIGIVLLLASSSVKEWSVEYGSKCKQTSCSIDVKISEPFKGNVYFYYGLDNYFQNHRRYVKSRSDSQLAGNLQNTGDCAPLDKRDGKIVAPCGAIANSMFNDTFRLFDSNNNRVPFTPNGVVWEIDRDLKFKNPPVEKGQNLSDAFKNTVKPKDWQKNIWELDPENPENNGFQNVDFIVWMRTAALPSFRKLYRILDRSSTYKDGLPAGQYRLEIKNHYPVEKFDGKKHFIISTASWIGGKNKFLGIAYVTIGSICVLLGAVFSFIHIKFGHSFAEMADIATNGR